MQAVAFFRGLDILAKYKGERIKQKGDKESTVRFVIADNAVVSSEDKDELLSCGYHEDGRTWYANT